AHVAASLGVGVGMILDGGQAVQGIESTIIALRPQGWSMLRPGPVTREQIAAVVGGSDDVTPASGRIEAPGQLASHYNPGKPVRLNAVTAEADEFLIGYDGIAGAVSLSPSGDLAEAASRLYACLHAGAAADQPRIAVAPIPDAGVGAAINDRLGRAAV
ncbi:MAG: Sua5 family C-terminal domain-containing protein, partial [Novosphingobium sp.]